MYVGISSLSGVVLLRSKVVVEWIWMDYVVHGEIDREQSVCFICLNFACKEV
jgi:hypothetical protein